MCGVVNGLPSDMAVASFFWDVALAIASARPPFMAAGYEVEEAVWPAVLLVSCQQSGIPHISERSVERDGQ